MLRGRHVGDIPGSVCVHLRVYRSVLKCFRAWSLEIALIDIRCRRRSKRLISGLSTLVQARTFLFITLSALDLVRDRQRRQLGFSRPRRHRGKIALLDSPLQPIAHRRTILHQLSRSAGSCLGLQRNLAPLRPHLHLTASMLQEQAVQHSLRLCTGASAFFLPPNVRLGASCAPDRVAAQRCCRSI